MRGEVPKNQLSSLKLRLVQSHTRDGRRTRGPTKRRGGILFVRPMPAQDNNRDMACCTQEQSVDCPFWHNPVLSRRKPRLLSRLSGVSLLRFADRQFLASLIQLPPRLTRLEPDSVVILWSLP